MLLLPTGRLPEGTNWLYDLKLDGYCAIAVKSDGHVRLWSWNENDLSHRYPSNMKALATLPDETVIDGEIVALDPSERRSFNALQNYGTPQTLLLYYLFDVGSAQIGALTLTFQFSVDIRNDVEPLPAAH